MRQAGIRRGVLWVDLSRPLEVCDRLRQVLFVVPPQMVASDEILLMGGGVDGDGRRHPSTFFRRDLNPDLVGDYARHFALQLQHVRQLALVFACPQVRIGRGVNQLNADLHAITCALHRAFDHPVDIQRAGNLRQRLFGSLEAHY